MYNLQYQLLLLLLFQFLVTMKAQ